MITKRRRKAKAKTKTKKTKTNNHQFHFDAGRKHVVFKQHELAIIKAAIDKAAALEGIKLNFSQWLRRAAVRSAEALTQRRIAP